MGEILSAAGCGYNNGEEKLYWEWKPFGISSHVVELFQIH